MDKTEQKGQIEGRITIGYGEIASERLLSNIIRSFHEKYPRVNFNLFTATADLVKEQMDKGIINIGLLLEPIDIEKYEFIRLNMKERWIVLMRTGDPLAAKESVTAKDLSKLPLILPRCLKVQSELAS